MLRISNQIFVGAKDVFAQSFSERFWVAFEPLAPEGKVRLVLEKEMECCTPVTGVRCFQILERYAKDRRRQFPLISFKMNLFSP